MYIMALSKETVERLLNRLGDLQKEIEAIHAELLAGLDDDVLSEKEVAEIKAIREEDDYRTLDEWSKTVSKKDA